MPPSCGRNVQIIAASPPGPSGTSSLAMSGLPACEDRYPCEETRFSASLSRCSARAWEVGMLRLASSGLAGERIAVVDGGSVLSIATMLAAARIGAAAALMNPALTAPELQGLVKNAGCASVAVAGEAYVERLADAGMATVLT